MDSLHVVSFTYGPYGNVWKSCDIHSPPFDLHSTSIRPWFIGWFLPRRGHIFLGFSEILCYVWPTWLAGRQHVDILVSMLCPSTSSLLSPFSGHYSSSLEALFFFSLEALRPRELFLFALSLSNYFILSFAYLLCTLSTLRLTLSSP